MSAQVAIPVTRQRYSAAIAAVLRCFESDAHVSIESHSSAGFGHEHYLVNARALAGEGPPVAVLRTIAAGWSVRVAPFTRAASYGSPELPVLFCLWRPKTGFGHSPFDSTSGHMHHVTEEAITAITTALATLPAPSILVDAGPEVWAGWRLKAPLRDMQAAIEALRSLAVRLGGEPPDARDATFSSVTLPLAGVIRNWNQNPPESIAVTHAAADRLYDLEALNGTQD